MKALRWTTSVLLLLLGLGGLAGGIPLILDPSGKMMSMPIELLQYSPFHTFLIPGIILFCANGLMPLWIFMLTLRRSPNYGFWTAFQGATLFLWIAIECIMLRLVMWAHYLYGGWALVLLAIGFLLWRAQRKAVASTVPIVD